MPLTPLLFTNALVHTSVPAEGSSLRRYALVELRLSVSPTTYTAPPFRAIPVADSAGRALLVVVWCVQRRLPPGSNLYTTAKVPGPIPYRLPPPVFAAT